MAGDPADIGRAPVGLAVVVVENVLVGHGGVDHVAAGRVQHALGLPRRARGVEDEERVFGRHLRRRAVGRGPGDEVVIPDVAAVHPADLAAGALHHHALLDARAVLQRGVGVGLEWDRAAAAQALVGGDDERGIAVLNAARERIRREAAEHHGVDGADPRAGQHGDGRLRDHGQVDRDAVAFLRAEREETVGEARDRLVKLPVGKRRVLGRVVALPDDRHLVAAVREVAVDAVGAGVERAVLEPADVEVVGLVGDVLDLAIGPDPVDPLAMFGPEPLRVLDRAGIPGAVGCVVAVGRLVEALGHGEQLSLRHRGATPP